VGRAIAAGVAVLALSACGYGFSQRYVSAGGADRIYVRPFRNLSAEPELGAVVTAALRGELARRGSGAGEGAPAVLDGEIRAADPVLTSTAGATWRIAVEVRARLAVEGTPAGERMVRREIDYLGADPLETEGRRALALRRAADEAARELLRAFQQR
jgi:hypothetical protein